MFSILRQFGTSQIETRLAAQYALTFDVPIKSARLESLPEHRESLQQGLTLPIGSVEFVRNAMALAGIREPDNITYPAQLRQHLYREVHLRQLGDINQRLFVKPTTTKTFTGFVYDSNIPPDQMSDHDREQYDIFVSLPPDTTVWTSTPVTWLSEYRFYVRKGEILGSGRYDDGPDSAPIPQSSRVKEMAAAMLISQQSPAAFSIDVGVLASGETALVECNDAWALGYYRGSLNYKDYIHLLWTRWDQLVRATMIA